MPHHLTVALIAGEGAHRGLELRAHPVGMGLVFLGASKPLVEQPGIAMSARARTASPEPTVLVVSCILSSPLTRTSAQEWTNRIPNATN